MKWENATTEERSVPFAADIRRALDLIEAGNKCSECRVALATTVVRRKFLMCETCATIDRQWRTVDAVHKRIHRRNRSQ